MSDAVNIWEQPQAQEIYMLAGWRQWADAGSVSSGLPRYLALQTGARPIGALRNDGFYLFQIPGTHDLLRPVVKFNQGLPESLDTPRNELLYAQMERAGLVFFMGDEPHMDVERYAAAFLDAARTLGVRRIIGLGGVYGEVPYNKERTVHSIYSLPSLKKELQQMAVGFSDYHGGASIGSVICKRAGEQNIEYVSFYAFAPLYDLSSLSQSNNTIRIENDFMAWLGVTRRINHMLNLGLDLSDLERRSSQLLQAIEMRVAEMERDNPHLGVREYLQNLADAYEEMPFEPLDDFWEEKLRGLFDKIDDESA